MDSQQEASHRREWIAVVLTFVVLNLFYLWTQPMREDGFGSANADMARQIATGRPLTAEPPYLYRVGISVVVGKLFPGDVLVGFRAVNLACNIVTLVLFVLWLRIYIKRWEVRYLLILMMLSTIFSPLRQFHMYIPSEDESILMFMLAGMMGIQLYRRGSLGEAPHSAGLRRAGLALVLFVAGVGTLFGETMLAVVLAFFFVNNPFNAGAQDWFSREGFDWKKVPRIAWVVLAVAIGSLLLAMSAGTPVPTDAGWPEMLKVMIKRPIVYYLLGILTSFGPLVAVLVYRPGKNLGYLMDHQYHLVFLAAILFHAWIGHQDYNRHLFRAMIVVYPMLGVWVEQNFEIWKSKVFLATVVVLQVLSHRFLWPHPSNFASPPGLHWWEKLYFFTTLGRQSFLNLHVGYMSPLVQAQAIPEYFLAALALLLMVYKWERAKPPAPKSRSRSETSELPQGAGHLVAE